MAHTKEYSIYTDTILLSGTVHTVAREQPSAEAVSIANGRFSAREYAKDVRSQHCNVTRIIDRKDGVNVHDVNNSHLHLIRGGRNDNLEPGWKGFLTKEPPPGSGGGSRQGDIL